MWSTLFTVIKVYNWSKLLQLCVQDTVHGLRIRQRYSFCLNNVHQLYTNNKTFLTKYIGIFVNLAMWSRLHTYNPYTTQYSLFIFRGISSICFVLWLVISWLLIDCSVPSHSFEVILGRYSAPNGRYNAGSWNCSYKTWNSFGNAYFLLYSGHCFLRIVMDL